VPHRGTTSLAVLPTQRRCARPLRFQLWRAVPSGST